MFTALLPREVILFRMSMMHFSALRGNSNDCRDNYNTRSDYNSASRFRRSAGRGGGLPRANLNTTAAFATPGNQGRGGVPRQRQQRQNQLPLNFKALDINITSQIAVASDTLIASLKDGRPITDLNGVFPEGNPVQTTALRGAIMYSILRAHSSRISARLSDRTKRAVRTADMCKSLILLPNGKLLDLLNTRDQRHMIAKYDTAANFDVARMSRQEVTKLPPYCYAIYSWIAHQIVSGTTL